MKPRPKPVTPTVPPPGGLLFWSSGWKNNAPEHDRERVS